MFFVGFFFLVTETVPEGELEEKNKKEKENRFRLTVSFSHHSQVGRISAVCRRRAEVPLDDRLERTLPCVCGRLANQRGGGHIRARC